MALGWLAGRNSFFQHARGAQCAKKPPFSPVANLGGFGLLRNGGKGKLEIMGQAGCVMPHDVTPRDVTSPPLASPPTLTSSPPLTSPHLTSPHLTSPHLTSPHLTSPHLTSPHLTSPHLTSPHLTSPHLTSPHLTSPHLTSPHLTSYDVTSPHLTSPHLTWRRLRSPHVTLTITPCCPYGQHLNGLLMQRTRVWCKQGKCQQPKGVGCLCSIIHPAF